MQVQQSGMEIKIGDWSTRGKSDGVLAGSFLVVGASTYSSPVTNAYLALIPMEVVPSLEKEYGDFLNCKGNGSFVGSSEVIDTHIFTSEKQVLNAIKNIEKLMSEKETRPVIHFKSLRYRSIQIMKGKTSVNNRVFERIFSPLKVFVEKEDYQTPGFENLGRKRVSKTFTLNL